MQQCGSEPEQREGRGFPRRALVDHGVAVHVDVRIAGSPERVQSGRWNTGARRNRVKLPDLGRTQDLDRVYGLTENHQRLLNSRIIVPHRLFDRIRRKPVQTIGAGSDETGTQGRDQQDETEGAFSERLRHVASTVGARCESRKTPEAAAVRVASFGPL